MNNADHFDPRCLIIGGSAAGFFGAITAAQMNPKLSILILEKTTKLLSKVILTARATPSTSASIYYEHLISINNCSRFLIHKLAKDRV